MVDVQFYPIEVDYITNAFGKAAIRIFGVAKDRKRICCIDRNFEPYFYIILKKEADTEGFIEDIKALRENDSFVKEVLIEDKKNFNRQIEALKVVVNHPADVPVISKLAKEIDGVEEVRENDILFARRYLIDKDIIPLILCNVSGHVIKDESLDVDFAIEIESIKGELEDLNELSVLSFDIETYTTGKTYSNSKKDPIISVAFYGDDGFKKIITWKKIDTELDVTFAKNESELINEFIKTIKEYKPSCLIGYFTDGFDFPYLIDRANLYGIKLNIGIDNSNVKFNKRGMGNIKINGIAHIDILRFVKVIMGGSLQLENYSLDEVANALLGKRKNELDFEKIGLVWDSNSKEIEDILEYNLKDAELTYEIFKVISFDIYEITRLIGILMDEVARMSFGQLVEWYLIRRAKDFNELIPNKPRFNEKSDRLMHTYQGAFVYQPEPGLYGEIAVFDFKSLYPSIIVAHNIDPGMISDEDKNAYESPVIINENGKEEKYYFKHDEYGFIPSIIKDLILRRNRIKDIIKKEKKEDKILEARSYILKIVANATYGMFGYSGARWYSRECAAAITAFGRDYILKTIDSAKKEGYHVIFSDTDSIAIALENKTKQEALGFIKRINSSLPDFMELELENFYSRGLFVMKKNELEGAKKKYALVDEKGKLKIRGFETIRRDWSYVAKETQLKVLEIILKDNSVEKALEYAKKVIEDVRKKKIDIKKMTIRTQLRKNIGSYDSIGPHVRVAEDMKKKGVPVGSGSIISYVIVEGKGIIRDKAKLPEDCKPDEYDADYYLNNQIIPALKMIFEAVGYGKDILMENKEQSKLDKFFWG